MAEQYTPSDEDVRSVWVVHERDCGWEPHPGDPSAEFDRFLARVRRDAAREALDGLADVHRRHASESDQAAASDVHSIVASQALHYRDTHYPEETPCTCDSAPPEIGGAQHRAGCGEEPS